MGSIASAIRYSCAGIVLFAGVAVVACGGKEFSSEDAGGATAGGNNQTGAGAGGTGANGASSSGGTGGGANRGGTGGVVSTAGTGPVVECDEAAQCDDGDPCTDDGCVLGFCQHASNTDPCESDGDDCTTDVCAGGFCTHPASGDCLCLSNPDCEDDNPCTQDSCEGTQCVYDHVEGPCPDDGSACTQDFCAEGLCQHITNDLPAKANWSATASSEAYEIDCGGPEPSQVAGNIVDGSLATRWSSGKAQSGDEWVQVDFGSSVTLNHVTLDAYDEANGCGLGGMDYPRQYEVRMSDSAMDFNAPVVSAGNGTVDLTTIAFEQAASGRYLLISQVGAAADTTWWSITELDASCQ